MPTTLDLLFRKYSGDMRVTYNINSRLYAGFSALEASSWREGRVEKASFVAWMTAV